MILGTHNTMTYLKPRKWWMKLINFTAKCQSVDLETQLYNYNVRFIDMRVKFVENDMAILAHGLVEYGEPYDMLHTAIRFASQHPNEDLYMRVMFEDNFISKKSREKQESLFYNFCEYLESLPTPKNLHIVNGCRKTNWGCIYHFKEQQPSMEGFHASMCKNKLIHLWPWLYSKLHNKDSYKKGTDKEIMTLDFIEIGHE